MHTGISELAANKGNERAGVACGLQDARQDAEAKFSPSDLLPQR